MARPAILAGRPRQRLQARAPVDEPIEGRLKLGLLSDRTGFLVCVDREGDAIFLDPRGGRLLRYVTTTPMYWLRSLSGWRIASYRPSPCRGVGSASARAAYASGPTA